MEKHLICPYCGKEYIAINKDDCCPYCGSFNEFTITASDKFLSFFKKGSNIFKIITIIIIIVIIFMGIDDLLLHIWYTNMYEDIQTYQYYYSDDFVNMENCYIDKTKDLDETIQISVESENYDVVKLFDNFIVDQFYSLDLLVDLNNDLKIKDKNVYLDSCEFNIYSHFSAFRLLLEVDEGISFKSGKLYAKDSKGNKYLLDIKESFSKVGKLQDAFKDDFVGEIYGYLEGDFYAFENGVVSADNFIEFESIIFEIDGKEYECPINYDNIYGSNLIYWGVK